MMAVDSFDVNMILEESNWIYRGSLVYKDHVLSMSVGLSPRETENAGVWIPQRPLEIRTNR